MVLDNFRRKLRQEAQKWRDEGIISSSCYQDLGKRYQFDNLEIAARDRFVFIVIAIGSILLSLGIITFVAANWQAWSRDVKFVILISLFFATTITGFYSFREPTLNAEGKKQPRSKQLLGEGLLILAAFILGANIALMAQMFNISGSTSQLFLCWGLGVLIMAYGLSLTSLGVLSIILLQIGYWTGLGELSYSATDFSWSRLLVQHMPLVIWLLFVPLAYLCRSRWIFALAAIAFTISLQFNLNPLQRLAYNNTAPWVASFAFALPAALFWSYDDLLFPTINFRLFQPLAQSLALWFFGTLFYVLSFYWVWQYPSSGFYPLTTNSPIRSFPLIDLGIFSGLVVLQWLFMLRYRNSLTRRGMDITNVFITSFLAIVALIPFWHQAVTRIPGLAVFIFNILLGIFAFGLMRHGIEYDDRRTFWGGILLLTLQILSRMWEYDTDLIFRSFVFAMCGIGIISAGLWFERRLTGVSNLSNK